MFICWESILKNKIICLIPIVASILITACSNTGMSITSEEKEKLNKTARMLIAEFSGQLKPALKKSIVEGGFENAIATCATTAPKIAAQLSEKSGWNIKRVSLKARNKESAIPDSWERLALIQFEKTNNVDENAVLEESALIAGSFRFMKAQKTQALCLGCHGRSISPSTQQALNKYYPQDHAKDYSLGEIRGAFSLTKEL